MITKRERIKLKLLFNRDQSLILSHICKKHPSLQSTTKALNLSIQKQLNKKIETSLYLVAATLRYSMVKCVLSVSNLSANTA